MRIPLIGSGLRSRSLKLSPEIMVNAYPEIHSGKLSEASISGTAGKRIFADLGNAPIRMMHQLSLIHI